MIPNIKQTTSKPDKPCKCGASYMKQDIKAQGILKYGGWWGNCENCKTTMFIRQTEKGQTK